MNLSVKIFLTPRLPDLRADVSNRNASESIRPAINLRPRTVTKLMNPLTLFGLFAVVAMLVIYWLETPQPLVYPRIRGFLCSRFGLWIPARGVAIRIGRSGLVSRSHSSLVAGESADKEC